MNNEVGFGFERDLLLLLLSLLLLLLAKRDVADLPFNTSDVVSWESGDFTLSIERERLLGGCCG